MKHRIISAFVIICSICIGTGLFAQPHEGQKGDVNNDGSINVLDILGVAHHILGVIISDDQEFWRADLNGPVWNCDGDGTVNILDAVKIAYIILGTDRCFGTPMTDIDGNVYQTITIGTQVWMAENLKVTHYRNGNAIPNVTGNSEWSNLTTGAYCNYDNDVNNATTYGRLYNWYAVSDSRNIAPEGWHVPSDAEWQTLVDHLGGTEVAGGTMKTPGTIEGGDGLWHSPNTGATNESGFSALPGGYRIGGGSFTLLGLNAGFWSSTEAYGYVAWTRFLGYLNSQADRHDLHKLTGFSVRCVRD
jgi:uncharacterized protein (TIGR02145 family)